METPTDPVKATVKPVEESPINVVETSVIHVETVPKPDKALINSVEAQVKPVEVPVKLVEAPAAVVNTLTSEDLKEHQSIEESQAALLEEADEIAKFIQQSKPGKCDSKLGRCICSQGRLKLDKQFVAPWFLEKSKKNNLNGADRLSIDDVEK